jgi:hypothetical protein
MTILASVNNKTLMPGITPIADVPDAPTIGTATAGEASASVTFTAAATGGTPTSYTATSNPGSITGTASSSPITISGLTPSTSYTFTVTATNSTGTSSASSASNSVTPTAPIDGAYDALATVSVSSTVTSITFAGIPAGYKHLQFRALTVSNTASTGIAMRFNGDTGNNYKGHGLYGSGSAAGVTDTSVIYAPNFTGGAAATAPGTAIVDVLDYSSTSKNKTVRSLDGYDSNGSGYVTISSGMWMSTEVINTITFTLTSFLSGCQFALYGVK